jgi:hypothetical protein
MQSTASVLPVPSDMQLVRSIWSLGSTALVGAFFDRNTRQPCRIRSRDPLLFAATSVEDFG